MKTNGFKVYINAEKEFFIMFICN